MATKPLIDITFPDIGNTYTFIQGDNSLSVAGKAADAKKTGDEIADLKEALTTKADAQGTAPDLTAGSASQLLSDVGTEDKTPYLFRANPYDSDRVEEEIVGATVGWNQLVGADTSSVTVTSGHKLYTVIGGTASIVASAGTAIPVTGGTDMVIDLTAWFGSTIADYAYTLESATAGSGVAFIKALLPSGYLAYSAPTLKSVSGLSGHVMRGFNQWDEEWMNGDISGQTGETISGIYVISKNLIPILPGTIYYINRGAHNFWAFFYDANGNYFAASSAGYRYVPSGTDLLTTPDNARYMRFIVNSTYGTTYKNDICINISDPAKNGTYEPYKETTCALDSDLTLRGILKMDADHNVYADGDVYASDGTIGRIIKELEVTSATSVDTASTGAHYATFSLPYDGIAESPLNNYLSDRYQFRTGAPSDGGKWFRITNNVLFIFDERFTDLTTANNILASEKPHFIYELATPTTETADPFTSPQNCTPGGSEEYVYAEGGSGVPVGHNSKYLANLKEEIERVMVAVPDAPSSNGTYTLKATVASTGVTYAWVSD